jgi:hypothetical protein
VAQAPKRSLGGGSGPRPWLPAPESSRQRLWPPVPSVAASGPRVLPAAALAPGSLGCGFRPPKGPPGCVVCLRGQVYSINSESFCILLRYTDFSSDAFLLSFSLATLWRIWDRVYRIGAGLRPRSTLSHHLSLSPIFPSLPLYLYLSLTYAYDSSLRSLIRLLCW